MNAGLRGAVACQAAAAATASSHVATNHASRRRKRGRMQAARSSRCPTLLLQRLCVCGALPCGAGSPFFFCFSWFSTCSTRAVLRARTHSAHACARGSHARAIGTQNSRARNLGAKAAERRRSRRHLPWRPPRRGAPPRCRRSPRRRWAVPATVRRMRNRRRRRLRAADCQPASTHPALPLARHLRLRSLNAAPLRRHRSQASAGISSSTRALRGRWRCRRVARRRWRTCRWPSWPLWPPRSAARRTCCGSAWCAGGPPLWRGTSTCGGGCASSSSMCPTPAPAETRACPAGARCTGASAPAGRGLLRVRDMRGFAGQRTALGLSQASCRPPLAARTSRPSQIQPRSVLQRRREAALRRLSAAAVPPPAEPRPCGAVSARKRDARAPARCTPPCCCTTPTLSVVPLSLTVRGDVTSPPKSWNPGYCAKREANTFVNTRQTQLQLYVKQAQQENGGCRDLPPSSGHFNGCRLVRRADALLAVQRGRVASSHATPGPRIDDSCNDSVDSNE